MIIATSLAPIGSESKERGISLRRLSPPVRRAQQTPVLRERAQPPQDVRGEIARVTRLRQRDVEAADGGLSPLLLGARVGDESDQDAPTEARLRAQPRPELRQLAIGHPDDDGVVTAVPVGGRKVRRDVHREPERSESLDVRVGVSAWPNVENRALIHESPTSHGSSVATPMPPAKLRRELSSRQPLTASAGTRADSGTPPRFHCPSGSRTRASGAPRSTLFTSRRRSRWSTGSTATRSRGRRCARHARLPFGLAPAPRRPRRE